MSVRFYHDAAAKRHSPTRRAPVRLSIDPALRGDDPSLRAPGVSVLSPRDALEAALVMGNCGWFLLVLAGINETASRLGVPVTKRSYSLPLIRHRAASAIGHLLQVLRVASSL